MILVAAALPGSFVIQFFHPGLAWNLGPFCGNLMQVKTGRKNNWRQN
jgi:hypothetical protein